MLTLVLPEESPSHEEEVGLLGCPQALWAVLIANGTTRFALDLEPLEHLSPCAQFVRGITTSLYMQRAGAQKIVGMLNDRLQEHGVDSLFDDESFTKSRLYHWVIKTCHELSGSVASNLKHIKVVVVEREIDELSDKAHAYEKLGLSHWRRKMREEVNELDKLQVETQTLREKVQESLHGATAVLEARLALQQGDRIKTLTYLATIYLPLTTVTSFWA
ncbi:Glucose-methanol-choline oxidoreductase [Penicillium atrosanguineum]|uniref:Uncharacterized protein n=1 Tax=Penicillium atrosanguineum TaxID=1132637 RepID=A0A9W9QGG5_9EURO|nr:Glucose-methanol-choline oxidoreductase [Penicillium atrosanguineum]KAJ5314642.1 Glucose-methanol-choline oxidoreductase [Penicillium atrosanguineum]KAJ5331813.1 hypothetical protein N7476_001596 [Penicillium atrosanguineum]